MSIQIPILDKNNITYEIKDINNGFYSIVSDVLNMTLEQVTERLVNDDIYQIDSSNHELLFSGEPATLQTFQKLIIDNLVNTRQNCTSMDVYPLSLLLNKFPEINYIICFSVEILDDGTCYYPSDTYGCASCYPRALCTPYMEDDKVNGTPVIGTPIYMVRYTRDKVVLDYKQLLINDTNALNKMFDIFKNMAYKNATNTTWFYPMDEPRYL